MSRTITPELVSLDDSLGADKEAVIRALAARVAAAGRATDGDALAADALAREAKDETGLPGGIAIPHAKSAAVTQASLAFARLRPGVEFGAPDGPADLVFLIAAPDGAAEEHLAVLSKLARSLMQDSFTTSLREASTPGDVVAIVDGVLDEGSAPAAAAPAAAAAAAPATAAASGSLSIDGRPARIVAVTSCATGIAHTFMAADALTNAGRKDGVDLTVEPQGSSGYQALPQSVIDDADAVIFANDVDVREEGRFAGKPVVRSGVKRGIEQPSQLIAEAVAVAKDPNGARVSTSRAASSAAATGNLSWGANIQRILLTGVSYMIPFVAGGGLLIALGFLLGGIGTGIDGYQIVLPASDGSTGDLSYADWALANFNLLNLPPQGLALYLGAAAIKIGGLSLGFLVPALAGYIAFAIADRPGIAPGFVVGAVSGFLGAGFIGGIVGGLLAGYAAKLIGKPAVPRWLRGLMPVVIIPLGASIIASGLMILVLGGPIAALTIGLQDFLTGLSGTAAIGLGVILGLMMCFDLGGPINKVAYAFAVAGLAAASPENPAPYTIMAAVMAAGMVPPLGMALASTVLYRKGFTPVERENGATAWLLGAAFISEGAIPFAAADPLRVIPANLVGGAITGALSMGFAVQSLAPHGGIFVFFAINPLWGFLLSLVIGTVVTAVIVVALKRFVAPKSLQEAESAATAAGSPALAAA